jgi:hypothetical protein
MKFVVVQLAVGFAPTPDDGMAFKPVARRRGGRQKPKNGCAERQQLELSFAESQLWGSSVQVSIEFIEKKKLIDLDVKPEKKTWKLGEGDPFCSLPRFIDGFILDTGLGNGGFKLVRTGARTRIDPNGGRFLLSPPPLTSPISCFSKRKYI